MVLGSFGVKLNSRSLLLTEHGKLVHFSKESDIKDPHTNVFFYIKDDQVCEEKNDQNFVTNIVELSKIPIYAELNRLTNSGVTYEPAHNKAFSMFMADGHTESVRRFTDNSWCPRNIGDYAQ